MQVEIYSADVTNSDGCDRLKDAVNQILKTHSKASIQWLQSSAGSSYSKITSLTAIITYDE